MMGREKFIDVAVKGTSPLLMNRFVDETGGTKSKKQNYNDEDEAKKRLYVTAEGELYQPAEHFEQAMIKAGTEFKYRGRKTFKEFIKSGVFVSPDAIPHKIQDWEIDKRPVVIQKSRIMRARPILHNWELEFQIQIINPDITPKDINEILDFAGKFGGVGDYRPKYGRFMITKFDF